MSTDDIKRKGLSFVDQNIAKLDSNKVVPPAHTIASVIADVREQAKNTMKLCDMMEEIIGHSEADARKAADTLLELIKRVK